MRHGDVVEVSIEKVGVLTNPIRDESPTAVRAAGRR
jgi:2-keto-4-pentenoate hydratase/2-oxohepta-3-ene-1,7-dioic acid hydratase in catechol pathway